MKDGGRSNDPEIVTISNFVNSLKESLTRLLEDLAHKDEMLKRQERLLRFTIHDFHVTSRQPCWCTEQ